MKKQDFYFALPQELIAQEPLKDRASSRLLVLNKQGEIEHNDHKEKFYQALEKLNPREKQILMMRYGLVGNDELTQKDVAEILGISQSYISRLEKKIIKKLRTKLNDE